jgi:hypothetical protein
MNTDGTEKKEKRVMSEDVDILRELAEKYVGVTNRQEQKEKRKLWKLHNSFKSRKIPVIARAFAWSEMPQSKGYCSDPFFRQYEAKLRKELFRSTLGDDWIFEPWVSMKASLELPPEGVWGLPPGWIKSDDPRGAKQIKPPVKSLEDIGKMVMPSHVIDEEKTKENYGRLTDAIGDIINIYIDRSSAYTV